MSSLIIGHRGAAGLARENTRDSFDAALAAGVAHVETDVRVTADGVLCLCHDPVVGGREVAGTSFAELSEALDGTLLRVEELLDDYGPRLVLNLELKTEAGWDETFALVRARGLEARVVVTSFHHRALARSMARHDAIRHGALIACRPTTVGALVAELPGLDLLVAHGETIDAEMVREARSRGIETWSYTINHERHARSLAALGVSGLITDYPDRLLAALGTR